MPHSIRFKQEHFMNIAEFHQNIEQVWQKIEEELEAQGADVDC